jgi:hypothetical protein
MASLICSSERLSRAAVSIDGQLHYPVMMVTSQDSLLSTIRIAADVVKPHTLLGNDNAALPGTLQLAANYCKQGHAWHVKRTET